MLPGADDQWPLITDQAGRDRDDTRGAMLTVTAAAWRCHRGDGVIAYERSFDCRQLQASRAASNVVNVHSNGHRHSAPSLQLAVPLTP